VSVDVGMETPGIMDEASASRRGSVSQFVAMAVALAAAAVLPLGLSESNITIATSCLIFALATSSLDLILGCTGMASLGHATYFGAGAYVGGYVAIHATTNGLADLLVGAAAGAALAVFTGALALRSREVYFLMLTVAFTELASILATNWESVTGGSGGLIGVPGYRFFLGPTFSGILNPHGYYYITLVAVGLSLALLWLLRRSPWGRALVGIRESELRMEAIGYPVRRYKLTAYVVAAGIAGLAGALWAGNNQLATPTDIGFDTSALMLIMATVGGVGSFVGPIIGAVLIETLQSELEPHFQSWEGVVGAVFILVVYLAPGGLVGLFHRASPSHHVTEQIRRRHQDSAERFLRRTSADSDGTSGSDAPGGC
jgi:branched-chain amino acid transport system permease protein